MMAAVLLGIALVALAVPDLWSLIQARHWKGAALCAGLWAVGMTLALLGAAGVELPTLSRWIVQFVRPLGSWIP